MNWQEFLLPMNEKFIESLKPKYPEGFHHGVFFENEFNLNEIGDTYFNLANFSKGVVWVNGHNLGRYWNKGPQFHLYCPASWLKRGKNKIVVFDLFQTSPASVNGVRTLE